MDDPAGEQAVQDQAWADAFATTPHAEAHDLKPVWEGKVTNRQFAEWLTTSKKLRTNCSTLPLTMATWLAFLVVVWLHGNVDPTFRMRQCLRQSVIEVEAPREIEGGISAAVSEDVSKSQSLKFGELTSKGEMWTWIIGGLIPAFSGTPARPGFVRTFNQVIGDIQLRETRMTSGTCKASAELAGYYRQACFSGSSISSEQYGASSGTDLAFVAGAGMREPWAINKERFLTWLSVRYPSLGMARAEELRQTKWVDDATESVEAHIALFNAEIKAYAHIRVSFSFKDGGLVDQELQVRPMSINIYPKWYYCIPDIIWVLLLIKFIANSAQRAVDSKKRGCCRRCCESPWLALDWLSIFLGLILAGFFVFFFQFLGILADDLGKLGEPAASSGNGTVSEDPSSQYSNLRYNEVTAGIIEELQLLIECKVFYRLGMYWYCMTLLGRAFQGFRGQPRIMQITSTVSSAFADLCHFGLILVVVFVNYALAGYVLFGPEVPEWSRVNKALQSTLGVPFGRLNYNAIHEIAPYTAVMWLFSFTVSVVFILMNLLLAIIMDHYSGVWTHVGDRGHDLYEQLVDIYDDTLWAGNYMSRFVYRIVWDRLPPPMKKCFPKLSVEPCALGSAVEVFCQTPYRGAIWCQGKVIRKEGLAGNQCKNQNCGARFENDMLSCPACGEPHGVVTVRFKEDPYDTLMVVKDFDLHDPAVHNYLRYGQSIPYLHEWILKECEALPDGFATPESLQQCGCDEKTASRLIGKCYSHVRRHVDEFYPLDKLFSEFDESMRDYHTQLDGFTDELRAWFSKRIVDSGNLEPRQQKLQGLAEYIKLANDPSLERPGQTLNGQELARALEKDEDALSALSDASAVGQDLFS